MEFEEAIEFIRRNKQLQNLSKWYSPLEIVEAVIENPVGNTDIPTFMDTLVHDLEDKKISEKLLHCHGLTEDQIYDLYEMVAMSLESLQNLVDSFLVERIGTGYFGDYKVVRWLANSTAVIGIEPVL